MSTIAGNDREVSDVFREDTSGQRIDLDLVDPDGVPIDTLAIDSVVGSLWAPETNVAIFAGEDLLDTLRLSFPGEPGRIRVTFTSADMVARGPRVFPPGIAVPRNPGLQRRVLEVVVTYNLIRTFVCTVTFPLVRLLRGAPVAGRVARRIR
jgi:hypothetical protein